MTDYGTLLWYVDCYCIVKTHWISIFIIKCFPDGCRKIVDLLEVISDTHSDLAYVVQGNIVMIFFPFKIISYNF